VTERKTCTSDQSLAVCIQADLRRDLLLGVHLENLPQCKELIIPPSTTKYKVKLRVYDDKNRLLELILRIKASKGGSLKVIAFSLLTFMWIMMMLHLFITDFRKILMLTGFMKWLKGVPPLTISTVNCLKLRLYLFIFWHWFNCTWRSFYFHTCIIIIVN